MIEGAFNSGNYAAAKELLDVAVMRHKAIATNIANAETPGYHRMRVNQAFEAQLQKHIQKGEAGSFNLRPSLEVDPDSSAIRADGNNVEIDRELMDMNRNALEYQYLTARITGRIKLMKQAITGSGGA